MEDDFEVNFWENFFGNCRDNLGDNFGNKLSGSHHVIRQSSIAKTMELKAFSSQANVVESLATFCDCMSVVLASKTELPTRIPCLHVQEVNRCPGY